MATILLIDDEPNVVKLFQYNLEADGHEVVTAHTGEEGLVAASVHKPDLVILDYMMPGLDGLETCRKLKDAEATHDVPVIMITCRTSTVDTVNVLKAGAVDYVNKPVDPVEVTARVRAHLRQSKAARMR